MQAEERNQDVKERDNIYVVEISLQEYEKEELSVRFYGGYLTVTASKMWTEEHIGYKSAFYLGHEVARDNIRAAFNGGILKIMIPKDAEHTASEPIEIEIM